MTMSSLERHKRDLDRLIKTGDLLAFAMHYECFPEQQERLKAGKSKAIFEQLPEFGADYQVWYSEALELIRQVLPRRLDDFCGYYNPSKTRKKLTVESYRVSDYLQGLSVTRTGGLSDGVVVGPTAAISPFKQQVAIVKAAKKRFASSLFDIKQIVQADLFDSELDAARELVKRGYVRAGGAIAGVVLERHLAQVCENHSVTVKKKRTVANLNDALKNAEVLDVPQWRLVQRLGDIRNLCDHSKDLEPTTDQVTDLVDGVAKIVKTLY